VIPASENLSKHDTYRDSDRIEYIQRIVRLFEDNA
jgi:hypothetical protein